MNTKYISVEEALQKANDTHYGLAASIWTNDIAKATRIAHELESGEVWINDHLPLMSEMPHGGIKNTGHGIDLSIKSLEEFTFLKHTYIGLE